MVENTPLTPLGRATRAEQHQNHDLLQQITLLCATVQSLGTQMQDVQSLGKQNAGRICSRRQRPLRWNRLKMRLSRGGKKDIDALKEEMKNVQRGSGSTVCSEASNGLVWEAPRPSPGLQLQCLPRGSTTSASQERLNLRGWVADCKQCSNQGLTDTEVSAFIGDLQKMLQTIVSMWFRNEAKLPTMVGMLEAVRK